MTHIPYSRSRKIPLWRTGPRAEGAHLAGSARKIKQSCLLGAALLAGAGAAGAQTAEESTAFQAEYGAYYLGLKLMETSVEASFGPDSYEAHSLYRTGGLISWAKRYEIASSVRGVTDGERLLPAWFQHRDLLGEDRTTTMAFTPEDIVAVSEPAHGSMGQPPATREQRAGALDLISGIMQVSMNFGDDPAWPCGRDVPIFDGKQRYDLRMAYAGREAAETEAYTGPVVVCQVYYVPVAGYDPEDWPKEHYLNTPLTVWLTDSETDDFHVPVRFSYPVGIGTLVIEAKSLSVQTAAVRDHASR